MDLKPIDVLFSYHTNRHSHLQRILDLAKFLRTNLNGFNVWLDVYDAEIVGVGEAVVSDKAKNDNEKYQRIDKCSLLLCCLSDEYSKSESVYELSYANQTKKKTFFVLLEDVEKNVTVDELKQRFGFAGNHLTTKYFRYNDPEKLLHSIENFLKVKCVHKSF